MQGSVISGSLLILLIAISGVIPFVSGSSQNNQTTIDRNGYSQALISEIGAKESAIAATLNQSAARLASQETSLYASDAQQYRLYFDSIYNTWSFDHQGNVNWTAIGVVYKFTISNGTEANLIVETNPYSMNVTGVVTEHHPSASLVHVTGGNWAGYSFFGGPNYNSEPNYQVVSMWTVPTPSASGSLCNGTTCEVAVWTGLMDIYTGEME